MAKKAMINKANKPAKYSLENTLVVSAAEDLTLY